MNIRRTARRLALAAGPIAIATAVGCYGNMTDSSQGTVNGSGSGGGGLRGAIFTTLADGSRVNANVYASKADVYLDGGPGPHAPSGAAALPEGDYYFQVTDPSGKTLLSTDDIACRELHVGASGFIDAVVGPCPHATGVDADYGAQGAITVQLLPYDDTPNHGGEYKVWVTAVADYGTGKRHGFEENRSKTDNFKVRVSGEGGPDAGVSSPDAGASSPDGSVSSPDAGVSSPDACTHDAAPDAAPPK